MHCRTGIVRPFFANGKRDQIQLPLNEIDCNINIHSQNMLVKNISLQNNIFPYSTPLFEKYKSVDIGKSKLFENGMFYACTDCISKNDFQKILRYFTEKFYNNT